MHELWLSEFGWGSLEVLAPLYDTLCERMALHGRAFARHGDEWRVIVSDEPTKSASSAEVVGRFWFRESS
jgi:hypothetical protein